MPDILIAGGSGDNTSGPLAGLLGLKLLQDLGGTNTPATAPAPPAGTAGH